MGGIVSRDFKSQKCLVKDYLKKFDADEVEILQKIYKELSARSPGLGIGKETFLQYFPLPGFWGERLFQHFDFKGIGAVDYDEFLIGIAICCRGTKSDRIQVLFNVFDLNNDGYIQKSELVAMLSNLPNLQMYVSFDGENIAIFNSPSTKPAKEPLYSDQQLNACFDDVRREFSLDECAEGIYSTSPEEPPSSRCGVLCKASSSLEPCAFLSQKERNDALSLEVTNVGQTRETEKRSFVSLQEDLLQINTDNFLKRKILMKTQKEKARQAGIKKNPSALAQSLLDKEREEESKPSHVDVESLVDKIIEECEFVQCGQLSFLDFKTWLERHEGILMMFTECLHEEVWGLQGNALYRSTALHDRQKLPHAGKVDSSITPLGRKIRQRDVFGPLLYITSRRDINLKPLEEIRPEQFSKVKRLFTRGRPVGMDHTEAMASLEPFNMPNSPFHPSSALCRLGEATAGGRQAILSSERGEASTMVSPLDPYLLDVYHNSREIVSMELVDYIRASQGNIDVAKLHWSSHSTSHKRTEFKNHEVFSCPNCQYPFIMCSECQRFAPSLKFCDGKVFLECSSCKDGRPQFISSCWYCKWDFQQCMTFIDKTEPSKDGILYKIGKHLHQWRARYFVLIDNVLYYYLKKNDPKPKGFLFLEGCYVEGHSVSTQLNKIGFTINHIGEKVPRRVLYTDNAEECQEWMDALRSSMKQQSLDHVYHVCEQIGQGKFSVVYRCIHRQTGNEYALKVIDKGKVSEHDKELLRSEMAILRLLRYPNVIYFKEVLDTKDRLYIAMELVRGGELYDLLHWKRRLPELYVNRIVCQLLYTVAYLHKCGIMHRDIKPENILLIDKNPEAMIKLTDFGLSTLCGPNELLFEPCGTLAYVAPEVLTLKGYNHKVDTWSIGVVMFLLLRGRLPFPMMKTLDKNNLYKHYTVSFEGQIWEEISSSAKDLVGKLLQPNPRDRISIGEALQHIWIKNPTAVIKEDSPGPLIDDYGADCNAFVEEDTLQSYGDISPSFVVSSVAQKAAQANLNGVKFPVKSLAQSHIEKQNARNGLSAESSSGSTNPNAKA
ncbi:calcium dependent protein kinase CDPK7 [Cardiosporidium cionae]|uniref:Calcium dependent protein kinase CDPK7 n=1 Tax=Cardiosporidium cionae TaxID=476202 RepID=A0ABQ7J724_9APIC|nr:calcium dependent protein kinase CDPK7 [Cardiosporidium cionae]|eukprot:KAF8819781.1 calcium dependent protein kinase CDPK7 [Cardiosporidium cionae]